MNMIISRLARPLALSAGLFGSAILATAAATLEAGIAEVDITPPLGHRMAGYFNERLATGVRDPLHAKAIVLRQGREKVALVFCDLIDITLDVSTNARAGISAQTGIPVRNILIAATHTHTGPLFHDVRRDFLHEQAVKKLGHDPAETIHYPDFLVERLVRAAGEAHARLSPARLRTAFARVEGLAFNRRYHMKDGSVAFNPGVLNPNIVRPAGPVDPDVGLVFVEAAASGDALGSLTVFACHCDTVGGTAYSADYPFFLQETLRGRFGAQFCSAFAAGTCGDINHINVSSRETIPKGETTARIGNALGGAALRAYSEASPLARPRLAVRGVTLTVPLQEVTPEQVQAARERMQTFGVDGGTFFERVETTRTLDLARRGKTWPMEVQVFRLDKETALVGLPGEIFCDLGQAIKRASPFKRTIVMSICNDRPAYVPTRKAFAEGSYEVANSRVKPGGGEMLVDAAVKLLKQLH
jgi:hypothetical protein